MDVDNGAQAAAPNNTENGAQAVAKTKAENGAQATAPSTNQVQTDGGNNGATAASAIEVPDNEESGNTMRKHTSHDPATGQQERGQPKPVQADDVMKSTEPDDDSYSEANDGYFESEDLEGAPLITSYNQRSGEEVKNLQTVGWIGSQSSESSRVYINRQGKRSHARYRIEHYSYPPEYADEPPKRERASNQINRFGDKINEETGKPLYTKRHIVGIYGIAWKGTSGTISSEDVEFINPHVVKKWNKVPTYILIKWQISDTETRSTWETRTCLRTRWGTKDADLAIYQAAVEAEGRWEEAQTGDRTAESRSPSVGLVQETVAQQRAMSLEPTSASPTVNVLFKMMSSMASNFQEMARLMKTLSIQ